VPMTHVNALAVLVAAAAAFVLGAFWYSRLLFAHQWLAAQGYTPETLEALKRTRRGAMARGYVVSLACAIVTAYVLALLASYTQATTFAQGLWLGFLVWLGFAATTSLAGNMFSTRSITGWIVDAGYQLTYLLIMGVLLALWR
jgi:Protein of unknown function (DUF1761)